MNLCVPINTMILGKPLKNIIAFQFPEVKLSKNICAKTIANTFPVEMQKLSIKRPFPRYFIGVDSAYMLVVKAIVNPKLNP